MKQMAQQHGSDHDQLSIEYEEMWTNPDLILDQLEKHFEDDFHAKGFLSDLFMVRPLCGFIFGKSWDHRYDCPT